MKKLKKVIKKLPMKIIAIILVLAIILNYITPLTKVFADTYTYTLTFTMNANNQNQHTMVEENGNLKIDGQYVELRDGDNQRVGTATCVDEPTLTCTITVENGPGATLNYNSNNSYSLFMQGQDVGHEFVFMSNKAIAVQDYVEPQQGGGDNPGDNPSGGGNESTTTDAVVLWTCGNSVCYHEFENIPPFANGNSTFYQDTTIEADNKPGTKFNIEAEYKEWYLKSDFDAWVSDYEIATGNPVNWDTLEPEIIMGEPNQNVGQFEEGAVSSNACERPAGNAHWTVKKAFENCVNHYAATQGQIWTRELQPVGEPTENNAYVSYGDRNFKVVIYNSDYKGISTTADFDGLNYYPASWADQFTRTDQYDVSATDENHPTYLESILLEDTINIDVLPWNNYQIDTIEALDVPDDAVTITKENNRKFQIKFSSNFYDHVVFKITDTNNEESYVQIKRYTIDAWIRDGNTLSADFYFDRERSYEEFEITAKIIYNDGTFENVTLEAVEGFRDELGNPVEGFEFKEYEAGGKGLKRSIFEHYIAEGADRTVKDVYLNAEYKGSNASVYAGAYAGSGEGTPANLFHPEGGE